MRTFINNENNIVWQKIQKPCGHVKSSNNAALAAVQSACRSSGQDSPVNDFCWANQSAYLRSPIHPTSLHPPPSDMTAESWHATPPAYWVDGEQGLDKSLWWGY